LPPQSPASPHLSYDQLVSGQLVHRRHLSDVLVTGAADIGPDRFEVGVQWPVNHILLGRGAGADAALVAESVRQASAYIAHTRYDVPFDRQFLLSRLSADIDPGESPSRAAAGLVVRIDFEPVRRPDFSLGSFVSRAQVICDDLELATGAAYSRLVPAATYARTRSAARAAAVARAEEAVAASGSSGHQPIKIPASRAGVLHEGLVVVGEPRERGAYEIVVDPTNQTFFDHDVDHVPGMVLLEAARQAMRDDLGRASADFALIDLEFSRLVELDRPATVTVPDESTLLFEQDGDVVARGRYRVRPDA
jgi:hypothetical protein